jgi:hypothetical protein
MKPTPARGHLPFAFGDFSRFAFGDFSRFAFGDFL